MARHLFQYPRDFRLESGRTLPGYHIAYTTLGEMNAQKDNVVWIFHALTANSDPAEWWPGLVGSGKLFDPERDFIICANMPGSCYGSLGPLDPNPETGSPYFHDFPFFTPRDMIRAYQPLKAELGIERVRVGIGGSMGGQQLLEWAIEEPDFFENIFPLATNAQHSPWGIAFNASQRMSIEADATWREPRPEAGMEGMKAARSIALLSYRHYDTYQSTQNEVEEGKTDQFRSESYQRYQGEKLAKRFNAFSYYFLSKGMDSHNVGRNRGGIAEALGRVKARTLVIGIENDVLFPVSEQQYIASLVPGGRFKAIQSLYGHDGFLLESGQIQEIITAFLVRNPVAKMLNS
ncbi:MAG: homoserine O-acetyltransferase [Bacteroidota bacterium]|nr:homoserine O-acetyltransferase [Bacteroidota bacterium]